VLLATALSITLTDLNGRSEVGQNLQSLAAAKHQLVSTRSTLFETQGQTQSTIRDLEGLEGSTLDASDALTASNNSIAADNLGAFFDGINVSTLDGCLVGVVQSLDQVAVGQVFKAISELNAVTPICNAVQS
jgi:hypothetical protein